MIPLMTLTRSGKTWQEKMLISDRRMIIFQNIAGLKASRENESPSRAPNDN